MSSLKQSNAASLNYQLMGENCPSGFTHQQKLCFMYVAYMGHTSASPVDEHFQYAKTADDSDLVM